MNNSFDCVEPRTVDASQVQGSNQIRHWHRTSLCALLCLALSGPAIAQTESSTPMKKPANESGAPTSTQPPHHTSATAKRPAHVSSHATSKGKTRGRKVARKRGQQVIDSARAREIQTALIREHYLQGEPTGVWDSATQAAMQRYQADQGWQSKTTPDSRALIKLGLGPNQDHLLNPESAMTTTTTTAAAPASTDPKAGNKQSPPGNNIPQQ
jgi:Putative peptidoglycan binding domain